MRANAHGCPFKPSKATMIITNLLTNMMVLSTAGVIHTNTPAFQKYARDEIVRCAQLTAKGWHLEPTLIATNRIT